MLNAGDFKLTSALNTIKHRDAETQFISGAK